MVRLIRTRRLHHLERVEEQVHELRQRAGTLAHNLLKERARIELLQQAMQRAEALESYWRTRAEKFIDQVGASSGIISAPTMTDSVPPPSSSVDQVFAALGMAEINAHPAAATSAVSVTGVDPAAAEAAVKAALASV